MPRIAPSTSTWVATGPAVRVDELRQEGEEEQRDLRVEQLHDDRLPVGAPGRDADGDRLVAACATP